MFYEEQLEKEINFDRAKHEKKPLKDKKDDNESLQKRLCQEKYVSFF